MIEMNVAITIIILLILFTRLICKHRIGWKYLYSLWLLIPIRILLPLDKIKIEFSMMYWVKDIECKVTVINQHSFFGMSVNNIFLLLWGIVFCALLGLAIIKLLRFGRAVTRYSQVIESAFETKIRITPGHSRAFLFVNTIYVSRDVFENNEWMKYVVLHEQMHKRQLDPLWDIVRTVLQCCFWYNPFVWLASHISKRDSELSCDERVVRYLSEMECRQYCKSLLEIATKETFIDTKPECGFGIQGGDLKERIKNLYMPKSDSKRWNGILAAWCIMIIFATLPAKSIFVNDDSEKQITVNDIKLTGIE